MLITVKATVEGLVGHLTACGFVIDSVVPFVALPSVTACEKRELVRVVNPVNGKSCYAFVLDVGPWNEHDDAYVYGNALKRPAAESGIDERGRPTNHAGIDLGGFVARALGIVGSGNVSWELVR